MLKAPSTAKFPSYYEAAVDSSTPAGGGVQYVMTAYVDAENSFGAMLRNTFRCRVTVRQGSDIYRAIVLDLQ